MRGGGLAKDSAYPGELFVTPGPHVVPDFINVIEANGSLMPMPSRCPSGCVGLSQRQSFRRQPGPQTLRVRPLLAPIWPAWSWSNDWRKDFNLPADTVKGGLCCSGMFDLKPVRLSARSSYVKFTDETEQALSPPAVISTDSPCPSSSPTARSRRRNFSASHVPSRTR